MSTKYNVKVVANSVAATAAVFYAACIMLLWIAPNAAIVFFNALMHGVDVTGLIKADLGIAQALTSIITGTLTAWVTGWLFATVYNKFAK